MTRLPPHTIRLYQRSTPDGHDLYPVVPGERISRVQNAVWPRRVVTGPVSADAEEFLSSWTQDDYSGGFGIEDANETSDTSRIAFGVIDGRRPKSMCLPPLTTLPGAPWTPEALGFSLFRWFDASQITALSDTDPVTSWDDASSNDVDMEQGAGGATEPTYDATDAAINTKASVDFAAASSQRLEQADFSPGDNPVVVYAVWFPANSNDQTLLEIEGGATDPKFEIDGSGNLSVSGSTAVTASITKAAWRMTGMAIDGANAYVVIDGNARTTGNTGTADYAGTKATLGSDLSESSGFLNGSIAEVLILNDTVTQATEDIIFGYFAHKYGLAGNLPSNHPYKTTWPVSSTPSASFGAFRPLGDIGTQFYGGWDTFGILGWDADGGPDDTGGWYATVNAWPSGVTGAVNRCVNFCGYLFCPVSEVGDNENLTILSEATAGTGTLTVAEVAIHAVAVGLHENKLWAIDTSNELYQLTVAGALADPTNTANWTQVENAAAVDLTLDTGVTPTALIDWVNPAQEESLWAITRAQGAYILNPDEPRWVRQKINPGAHPDWGLAATVFREGEDLFIAGGGMDLTRVTAANVEVPISGPSKDQGVPPEYQGTIVDLCAERSTMYALVAAGSSVAAGSPTSTWVLQQTRGNQGSGNGKFQSPTQVAVDSSGNVYVADRGNDRIQKFGPTGAHLSNLVTGIDEPRGVAVDSSGNVYVPYRHGASDYRARKYTSAGVLQWTSATLSTSFLGHCATDGTNLFVTTFAVDTIKKLSCSTGSVSATYGASGTGNGQFDIAWGIAVDSTHVYVSDSNNARVQKLLKSNGSYVTQWGSSGSGNGEFTPAVTGIAIDASGDVWVGDNGNNRLQRFSNTGTYQTQIAQSSPVGIGVTSGDILWVSTGTHTLVEWDEESVSTPAVEGKVWLGAWTGTAWCALWETAEGVEIVPTWMHVSMKAPYSLWWGDEDGNAYYQLLPPPFFNPADRVTLGEYPFAPTGWMETVRFDNNMSGWDKVASHFYAMMEYAAPDVYVDISYRTDADQFDSGLLDPPYRAWKRVDHIGRTICWFDDTEIDPISGEPYREGEPFQWIQFRYDFVRGDDTFKSPIWMWHSLHFLAVPQDASSFVLKIPLKEAKTYNRDPDEMGTTLRAMQRSRAMQHLMISDERPTNADRQVFFRGRVTNIKSEFHAGAKNRLDEIVVVTFLEIEAADLSHTTVASDTPT